MLKLIEGSYASFFPREMDAMFRSRAATFHERLGWEVEVKNGHERDRFDDLNPLYVVSVDPVTEDYRGSLRLLPTTGPNMLRDVFPQLLDGEAVESATIWEISRICVASAPSVPTHATLQELIAGIGEVSVLAGLSQYVAVIDARFHRILRMIRVPMEPFGRPQRIGEVMTHAMLFEAGETGLGAVRTAFAIEGSVLAPDASELAFA